MMAKLWAGMFVFMLLMVVGASEVFPTKAGSMTHSQCKDEQRLLVNACSSVVFGHSPSSDCCARVRVTRAECACHAVTPRLAAFLGVERTIKQIEGCGRTVPRNFKCGSVTTP
ncbi:hypothetical protein COLO4_32251 [Corchorus olitorius]|uniref:Bifunctional inhibitor/plant lipid transfer protein/seed storage helical domain-containing protein n=1 Tax=Corchorus olitorius TaxID=93759 RepID=A0A1R3GZW7_9ROSI|nr:hypothetical protein COLO4_32251 [Corchorus olitorius]